ncbi:MAG: T9SS type A sorting domain-containing protein [Balneolales bacterium]|nr:T9SS type A sorting domain-containing protein [Balneolales bacterium]
MKQHILKLLLIISLFILHDKALAQLSGSYTVGEGSDYPTLRAAIDDLMAQGNSGDVVFLISSDIEETQNIAIGFDPGEDNTVTIKPAAGTSPVITFSASEDNGVYDGALIFGLSDISGSADALTFTRNIIIDGSNTAGGSSRDLTLQTSEDANGSSSFRLVAATENIEIANTNILINQSDNPFNTIRITSRAEARHQNVRIVNNYIRNLAANSSRAVLTDGITEAQFGPDLTVIDNDIEVNRYGVWLREKGGNSLISGNNISVNQQSNFFGYGVYVEELYSPDAVVQILENSFDGSASANTFAAVRASSAGNFEIENNSFTNLYSDSGITRGVWVDAGGSFQIHANTFNGFDGGSGVRMIEIANDLTENHSIHIANNYFTGFASTSGNGERLDGIYIASPDNAEADIRIYHNTLVMNPLDVQGDGWNYFGISSFSSASISIDLRNNILINNDSNPNVTSYLYRQVLSAASSMDADYNLWFVASPSAADNTFLSRHGGTETNATTLAQHQENTGFDSNSVSFEVLFEDEESPFLDESMFSNDNLLAPAISSVPTDFFGNDRNDPAVMGAHEPEINVNIQPEPEITGGIKLHQNYPNPFNPSTRISFELDASYPTSLSVYSVDGRRVAQLLNNQQLGAGLHNLNFDASRLSSGVYIYRLTAGNTVQSGRMMLIK